jgi:hypothetical protein
MMKEARICKGGMVSGNGDTPRLRVCIIIAVRTNEIKSAKYIFLKQNP